MHRAIYRLKLDDTLRTILSTDYFGNPIFGKDFDIQVFNLENRIVFTTGEKMYTFNDINDSIVPYENLNSQIGIHAGAHRIISGPDHHYWFIGSSMIGLFRIYNEQLVLIKEFPTGLFRNHLIAGYENIFPLDTVTGLLSLDNGFVILRADTPDLSHQIEEKRPILTGVESSNRMGEGTKMPLEDRNIHLPFHKNSVTLEFAFPLYAAESLSFQSYVEGLDQSWSAPQDHPVFHFTRIPAGEYRVKVRAFNNWNSYSREEEIPLIVNQPWYFSMFSIILYGLVIILLLLVGRFQLLRRIRLREGKIRESKERELIRLRNEKLNAELSFKSQELANSTMSIIKKNEFLLELKDILKAQKEELGTRYPEKYYSRLIRKIDLNISSMDDWNIFEIHFEKAHEKFLQKLGSKYPHLSHSDLRLCAYLRMNLSSKEIAPLLRISYRGVENHRYRLRKKLLLKKEVNLTDFILSL
jgi:DNA-binding CsgD family transcriptional regulator